MVNSSSIFALLLRVGALDRVECYLIALAVVQFGSPRNGQLCSPFTLSSPHLKFVIRSKMMGGHVAEIGVFTRWKGAEAWGKVRASNGQGCVRGTRQLWVKSEKL